MELPKNETETNESLKEQAVTDAILESHSQVGPKKDDETDQAPFI